MIQRAPFGWKRFTFAVALLLAPCMGDFGDYADHSFNCPATTTCPQVCVATVEDCPPELACPEANETLCADGSCAEECDEELETPCLYECAPVACNKIVQLYDLCFENYGDLYDLEASCGEEEEAYETTLREWTEPAFVFCYTWVSGLSFLIVVWCAYNQKINPVAGSTKDLQVNATVTSGEASSFCTQTGYKLHPIGLFLYFLTMATFAGWSALLAFLTIQYYVWSEQPQVDKRTLHFEDEYQLLKAFIVVWSVGFAWSFSLKWPYSVSSLFLRRCALPEATHVAVFLGTGKSKTEPVLENSFFMALKTAFERFFSSINSLMAFIFSDTGAHMRKEGIFQYCRVQQDKDGTRSFTFLLRRYNLGNDVFTPGWWTVGETLGELAAKADSKTGLTKAEVEERYRAVGPNEIKMEKPSFFKCLHNEFSKPFYVYQLFMVWTWFPLYYFYMAMIIAFTIVLSAVTVSIFHYRNLRNLYKITHIDGKAKVLRDGIFMEVNQTSLVPGDIVKLEPGISFCDMVVLQGDDTLVDESALTGEATPQIKTPIDVTAKDIKYSPAGHKRHTVSAGTTVEEAEFTMALVIKTASYTSKGELLREIFAFRRHSFKFDTEVHIVLGILILYAIFGLVIVVHFIEDRAVVGWFYGMYVVATAIPPLLPTTFTVSVGVSDTRLANKRVACSKTESILVAGKVTKAFFDKTGTLTKQGLDFKSARSASDWKSESTSEELAIAMACCHSIARTSKGELIGNPVDREMFVASGARFEEAPGTGTVVTDSNGKKIEVVRHFDFDHHRMTQSVVAKLPDGKVMAFVKGSGESISRICKSDSLPENFNTSLSESAAAGIYQISVAMKPVDPDTTGSITRDELESDCSFVGVLNFLNEMREDTPDTIRQLGDGSVDSIMITGDNTLNGVRVARESGILSENKSTIIGISHHEPSEVVWSNESGVQVDMPSFEQLETGEIELAVSGQAWRLLRTDDPKLAKSVVPFIKVFGRCTPHDKVSVVDTFVELGFICMMTGDGGNDCGALKAAHVGVALSDAEASIVAPFTSLDRSISSVVHVLREGRCALASAFAVYKYIIMYGQITFLNQVVNAYFQITFGEWNWVWIDGVWAIVLAYSLPLSRPAPSLAKTRPTASILGLQTVTSAVGMVFWHFIFLVIALVLLFQQDWFQCRKWTENDLLNAIVIGDNYESTVIWLVTGFQYISSAIALNFGYEFRQGWFRNYIFVAVVVVLSFIHFYVIFVPGKLSCFFRINCDNDNVVAGVTGGGFVYPIQNPFNTTLMPDDFQWKIFLIIIGNTIAVLVFEYFVVNGIRRAAARKIKELEGHKVQYRGNQYGARRSSVFWQQETQHQASVFLSRDFAVAEGESETFHGPSFHGSEALA